MIFAQLEDPDSSIERGRNIDQTIPSANEPVRHFESTVRNVASALVTITYAASSKEKVKLSALKIVNIVPEVKDTPI